MPEITVYDFIYFCVEPGMLNIKLWSIEKEAIVFEGNYDEFLVSDYRSELVQSYNSPKEDEITINIA